MQITSRFYRNAWQVNLYVYFVFLYIMFIDFMATVYANIKVYCSCKCKAFVSFILSSMENLRKIMAKREKSTYAYTKPNVIEFP